MAANADTVLNAVTLTEQRAPVDADGIADLAQRAATLNRTIRDKATHPNYRKTLRKFVGTEVAAILDLKVETLYRRIDRNPALPQGTTSNPRRREFSMEEVLALRAAFDLPPNRAPGQPGLIVSLS